MPNTVVRAAAEGLPYDITSDNLLLLDPLARARYHLSRFKHHEAELRRAISKLGDEVTMSELTDGIVS